MMNNFIDSIVECAPTLSIIISAVISYIVAKMEAKNEIKKLTLTLNHKDKAHYNEAFTKLLVTTEKLCNFKCGKNISEAIEANTMFLSVAHESFHSTLKELDKAIINYDRMAITRLREQLIDMFSRHIQ